MEHYEASSVESRRIIPKLIVIDGLDECHGTSSQTQIIAAFSRVFNRRRPPLRLVFTSRPEYHLVHLTNTAPELRDLNVLDLNNQEDADTDIRLYIHTSFESIRAQHQIKPSWPRMGDKLYLARQSSRSFIFPSIVILYVASPDHDPVQRLAAIMGRAPQIGATHPLAPLDDMYSLIFSGIPEEHLSKALLILSPRIFQSEGLQSALVSTIREQLPDLEYNYVAHISHFWGWTIADTNLYLRQLLSVVKVADSEVYLLHATLSDFLKDKERSGRFHIDEAQYSVIYCRRFLQLLPSMIMQLANLHYALDIVAEMFTFRKHSEKVNDMYEHPLVEDLKNLDVNLALHLPDKEADIFLDFMCHALSYPACDKIRRVCYQQICNVIHLRSHPTRTRSSSPLQYSYIIRDPHKHYWRNTYLAHFYLHQFPWRDSLALKPHDFASITYGFLHHNVPLHKCFPLRRVLSESSYDKAISRSLRANESIDLDLLVAYEKVSRHFVPSFPKSYAIIHSF
ncbi:hypothetical protein CVT24_007850 [Panaeolus cyanescens]|uniref:Nephrocystin 3-like N-terminal domain-containing protein n=1 Tax=Panaeolus cyanescens TaxID=181874 RepID=A0A409VZG7_9AGAR|nr:hypothetical protein CVT24_007850 [Panaeolus cyanescens]